MKHVPRFIRFFPDGVLRLMLCVVGCLVWYYVMYFFGINVMLPVTTLLLNKIHYMKDKVISTLVAGHPAPQLCFTVALYWYLCHLLFSIMTSFVSIVVSPFGQYQKIVMRNCNIIANGVLCDVLHRIYKGFL